VKGTVLIPLVKVLRIHRERVIDAVPPPLRHYFEERVLAASWYPAADHVKLARVLAPVMPPGRNPFVLMGRATAQMDLTGVYRAQLSPGDPQKTLRNFAGLWRHYCDSGISTLEIDGPCAARIAVRDFEGVSREMCSIVGGYIEGLVVVAGGKGEEVRKVKCSLDGHGECAWTIRWTA
jgi:hypothetical protein